ncbi:ras-related protein Rac1-like [Xenia sp. Carnegie-2017]|uniref:ras-related protein Rac1-like n=1 Tax=Xenia sp. Carnegie-2017 TaxID=2897299 RepID=UPI001F03CA41|nr:ras-related protein Rac1-like [Xenia sp. Carnegie-2017]
MPKSKGFFNVIIVGDSKVGKTCLLYSYKGGKRPEEKIPGFLQTFTCKVKVNCKKVELGIWDTSGDSQYDGLRRLVYVSGDIFVVCYSVDSRQSFENVTKKWLPELRKCGQPNAAVVVVATKKDLRPRTSVMPRSVDGIDGRSTRDSFVTYDEGLQLAHEIRAKAFVECSVQNESSTCNVLGEVANILLKQLAKEKEKKRDS